MKIWPRVLLAGCAALAVAIGTVFAYAGPYGLSVLIRHGGTYWVNVGTDSPRLSPSMRLALGVAPPAAAGAFEWRMIAQGFEVADLPVLANGRAVDHVLLARIDPARFRFVVRNASLGDKDLDQWMKQLGAALVVNGSYYA